MKNVVYWVGIATIFVQIATKIWYIGVVEYLPASIDGTTLPVATVCMA
jgi:hypothetical protein